MTTERQDRRSGGRAAFVVGGKASPTNVGLARSLTELGHDAAVLPPGAAWRRVRRPGWRLQLLGGLPADPAPLAPYRDEVEWLGRLGHADVPAAMARADVFVFPSLFEGSAVVTYEALACGLPSVVTPSAGSVVRDGIEGLVVPPAEVEPLAAALEQLGNDPERRAAMSRAARLRAEAYDWTRYHAALAVVFEELIA